MIVWVGKMKNYQNPRGTYDVLPADSGKWQKAEGIMMQMAKMYGYEEIRTPIFEDTGVFKRENDSSDMVNKEMYTFKDNGGRSITLKPEGTAGVIRSYVENKMYASSDLPKKLYYIGPCFRYERPQAGRLREHHQFGVEIFGSPSPAADAEVISIASELFQTLGCTDLTIKLNSIGCPKCRGRYQQALKDYLFSRYDELCETCKTRFETNPLRILDCKVDTCKAIVKDAPHTMDYVCDDCRAHMNELMRLLDLAGIRYEIDPMLVRGLDYYTKTVFEIVSGMPGAQGTLCGGGRYDGLIKELGGPDMPAVGFGLGMERLLLIMDNLGIEIKKPVRYEVMLIGLGSDAKDKCFTLARALRNRGVSVDLDLMDRSVKAQMKYADKTGALYTLVIGDEEISNNAANLKSMANGDSMQVQLDVESIMNAIRRG